jgi:sarcosine oxidase delta subunit
MRALGMRAPKVPVQLNTIRCPYCDHRRSPEWDCWYCTKEEQQEYEKLMNAIADLQISKQLAEERRDDNPSIF